MRRWTRRVALALVAFVGLVVLAGASYEASGRHRATRDFPAPGRLVDIGGRRIQLDCRGAGSPVVVFESGLDIGGSVDWSAVHDSIAATTRACAYSRAGIMWSDAGGAPRGGVRIADDLHAALGRAGERPPYVLVGHSLGGPYAMVYTKRYGADVAGLVFVDASHPDQIARLAEVTTETAAEGVRPYRVASAFAWMGVVRALAGSVAVPGEPTSGARARAAYAATSLPAMIDEATDIQQTLSEAGGLRTLGDRPLVVLSAGKPLSAAELSAMKLTEAQGRRRGEIWNALQDDEATWSSRGEHRVVPDAGHYIQFERPDVVISAVRSVVGRVRG